MIKSSIIRKILIHKFSLIGELRAALMLLHIITNNHTINFVKVDVVGHCKGNNIKMLLLPISSKYQFATLNFWDLFFLRTHRQTQISSDNETIGLFSWYHRCHMVNWFSELHTLNQIPLVIICILLIYYLNVKYFNYKLNIFIKLTFSFFFIIF